MQVGCGREAPTPSIHRRHPGPPMRTFRGSDPAGEHAMSEAPAFGNSNTEPMDMNTSVTPTPPKRPTMAAWLTFATACVGLVSVVIEKLT